MNQRGAGYKKVSCSITVIILMMAQLVAAQNKLTLEQSREAALQRNKRIVIQKDSIQIAGLGIQSAKTRALPSVDGIGTGAYFGNPINDFLPKTTESLAGTATQIIYAGGRVRNGIRLAQVNKEAQELGLNLSRADIIVTTDSLYWGIVYLKQQIGSLEQSRAYLRSALNDVNNGYEAGTKYKNDVLQIQIQYNQNELQLLKQRDALELAKLSLLQFIGMDMNADFDVADSVSYISIPLPVDSTFDSSVNNRTELKLLQKSLEAGRLQTKLISAEGLPQIAATAYGFYSHISNPGFINKFNSIDNVPTIDIDNNSNSWLGLVNVNVPIFHWGDYRYKTRQQQLRTDAIREQLTDAKQKLVIDIRQKYYALKEAEVNISVSELSLLQATENLRLATDRLKAGTILTTDWLQAQTLWQQSYVQAVKAKADYNVNKTKFERAIGELN